MFDPPYYYNINYTYFFVIIPIFFFIGFKIGSRLPFTYYDYLSLTDIIINDIDIVDYTVSIKNNSDKCIICLETLEISEVCKMKNCIHIFHKKCIKKWLNIKHNCPTCRTSIKID
jgi:hypothetical protein